MRIQVNKLLLSRATKLHHFPSPSLINQAYTGTRISATTLKHCPGTLIPSRQAPSTFAAILT
jgi:hypothetical protein